MADSMITKKEVEHIADLSFIDLTEEQKELYQKQLGDMLQYVGQLKEVPTQSTDTSYHIPDARNIWRHDTVAPSLTQEQALQNAPDSHKGYIRVKKVL